MAAFLFQRFQNEICVVCCCDVCRIVLLLFANQIRVYDSLPSEFL